MESTITLADDEASPTVRVVSLPVNPNVPTVGEAIALESVAPKRSGDSIGPAISSGRAEPSSTMFNVRYSVRSICQKLENIKRTGATWDQMTGLERKINEVLASLRRLDLSEVEKALEVLEARCAGQESGLAAARVQIEVLEKEKVDLVARVEGLEEGNCSARGGVGLGFAHGKPNCRGEVYKIYPCGPHRSCF
ncbi:hypothetical protein AXF42_Ash017500 [Apostasia shenzhenica]|uniref:Uncharacterized protein n=1 Tax=Apostasia shenzhenica TaxID=1088818 RepID=A0A2I0A327_9ASPA|nr:hypothetical protein AXF42_Ash017500 [Apostasia shenzhenica]